MIPHFRLIAPALLSLHAAPALAASVPAQVLPSSLLVSLSYAGNAGLAANRNNTASPVAIGGMLYAIDQLRGTIAIVDSGTPQPVVTVRTLPAGVTTAGARRIFNMAGTDTTVFVGIDSSTLPAGFGTPAPLPADAPYQTATRNYELIYRYDRAADGSLSNPVPVTAFESAGAGHRGEGMLVLPDGRLLYARGDNLTPAYNGLTAPQDPGSTLSKLLIIDGTTGAVEVAAQGIRNVQHLTYTDASQTEIAFADLGWGIAEEINRIPTAALVDTGTVENFGWGVDAGGIGREGTFLIDSTPPPNTQVLADVSGGDPGFLLPYAQLGREWAAGAAVGISGPVMSGLSFSTIDMLFGDLVSGSLFATLAQPAGSGLAPIYSVMVQATDGTITTVKDLLGFGRADLRFFNFADGGAGVLFEATQDFWRISEVTPAVAPVPLPATGALLALAVGGLIAARRRRGA